MVGETCSIESFNTKLEPDLLDDNISLAFLNIRPDV